MGRPDPSYVLHHLISTAKPFDEDRGYSDKPGVYGVFLFGKEFPRLGECPEVKPGALLYIGKTESSQIDRDMDEHFSTGKTGSSTLRRSLGAVLLDRLRLKPIPRSRKEQSNRKYQNYCFESDGDQELTSWMKQNLGLSFYEYECSKAELKRFEDELIGLAMPVLNLDGNTSSPWYGEVKAARGICRTLARKSDTE